MNFDRGEVLEIRYPDGEVAYRVPLQVVLRRGLETLQRQGVAAGHAEVERKVRSLAPFGVPPSYEFVARRARELGMSDLSSADITKLTWLLRVVINVANEMVPSSA
jgi:hypothetical protein